MKKMMLMLLIVGLVVPAAMAASLTTLNATSHSAQFGCGVCHDAHNNGIANDTTYAAPLWSGLASTESLTGYSIVGSRTTGDLTTTPAGTSLMCMGCHDGVSHTSSTSDRNDGCDDIANISANGFVNTEFMHPVSFDYQATALANATYFTAADSASLVGEVVLYSGNLECGSCHDIHDSTPADGSTGSALRTLNSQMLCDDCHIE